MKHRHLAVFLALLLLAVGVRRIEGDSLNTTSPLVAADNPVAASTTTNAKQKTGKSTNGAVTYTASYSVVRSALKRGKTMVMSVPVANKPAPVHNKES